MGDIDAETELRAELKNTGWKQGVVISSDGICDDTLGLLVLTQTCDCINPSFDKEPSFEVLPLEARNTKKGKPDPNYENGKNPREIHFYTQVEEIEQCVVANVSKIKLLPRKNHTSYKFASIEISPAALDDILTWRAARYLRPAFPDDFENEFAPLKERFSNYLTADEIDSLVNSILINISPLSELEEGDQYELHLLLLVHPRILGITGEAKRLDVLAKNLSNLLAESDRFDAPTCKVASLDEISLFQARDYLNFNRYDYLSFAEE